MNRKPKNLARLLKNGPLFFYNLSIVVFSPYFLGRKLLRVFTKKTSVEFLKERWTIPLMGAEIPDSKAIHVVFVATGFGEKYTSEQLTAALREVRPDVRVTWAVKDDVAVRDVLKEYPAQPVTFMPYDFLPSVATWLGKLQPDVVVSVEKLWIPNIAWASKIWGAVVVVVCGRRGHYRDKGLRRKLWFGVNSWTLRGFDTICLQSETEKKRLQSVLPQSSAVRITGAIKISRRQGARAVSGVLTRWMETQNPAKLPLLVAGSTTSAEEEALVLDAFEITRSETPCALLLAPRHLHRVDEVLAILRARNFSVNRRSEFHDDEKARPADVYLLDTMGELSIAYGFGEAAFVGGTIAGAGHNVIEPVEWNVPVFFGSGAEKSGSAVQELALEHDAGFRVRDAQELGAGWARVLRDAAWRETLRANCREVIEDQKRALEANLQAIVEAIDRVGAR